MLEHLPYICENLSSMEGRKKKCEREEGRKYISSLKYLQACETQVFRVCFQIPVNNLRRPRSISTYSIPEALL